MGVAVGHFLFFAVSQVATPGPANMVLMATGARYGFRGALPFVVGVAVGKQLIIWPIGFGLMALATTAPWLFSISKYISAGYILWLAWRVANMRLVPGEAGPQAPGFVAGLAVHPMNPKAWAMPGHWLTSFVAPETPAIVATATIAACLFVTQVICHPVWHFLVTGSRAGWQVRNTKDFLCGPLRQLPRCLF